MARILMAWELGGNGGHAVKLAALGRALAAEGHHVDFALQRLDAARAFRDLAEGPGARLRQAPLWPGLMRRAGPVHAWGDVLAEAGMTDSGVLEYLLRGWESLLADAAPDLVLAEFAPAAQLACQGRLPVVAFGTGYTVPPAEGFRPFFDRPPRHDEAALLRLANHALARLGRPALPHLAAIARADRHLPATFAELDPYRALGRPVLAPWLNGPIAPAGEGRALFAYLPDLTPATARALAELAASGVPILLHAPGHHVPGVAQVGALTQVQIAERAGLVLGGGGLGLTSACLAMGLPQVLIPTDAEKQLNATAAVALGAAVLPPEGADLAATLPATVTAALTDAALRERARALASGFARRLTEGPLTATMAAVHSLL